MGKTIIINEQQLGDFTRIDEVVNGVMDKIRSSIEKGKKGYQQDKERNARIRDIRYFIDELYVMSGKRNGTISAELYKAVRKAASKRIMQIQSVVKGHGLNFDGKSAGGASSAEKAQLFYATKKNLEDWRKYFGRNYTPEYMGQELYDAFERCMSMELGRQNELFYVVNKTIKPKMFELSKAKNFAFNG